MATQATSAAVVVQQQGGGDGGAMVAYTPAEAGGGQVRDTATHAVWVSVMVRKVGRCQGRAGWPATGTTGLFKRASVALTVPLGHNCSHAA